MPMSQQTYKPGRATWSVECEHCRQGAVGWADEPEADIRATINHAADCKPKGQWRFVYAQWTFVPTSHEGVSP
jgi:hypothetical protein